MGRFIKQSLFMSFHIPIIIYSPIAIFHFLLKSHWMQ